MTDSSANHYRAWMAELIRLSRQQDQEWLVSADSPYHRAAFDQGLSPYEELTALADMAEWRGCGCGGG